MERPAFPSSDRGGGAPAASLVALAWQTLALALAAGCAAPRLEEPPLLRVASEVHAGTLLTGPRAEPAALEAEPWKLAIELAYAEELPRDPGEPLSASVREVVVEDAEPLLQARGELVLAVRRADGLRDVGPVRWSDERVEALWPGTIAVVRAERAEHGSEFPHASWDRLALEVGRREQELEVALELEGWAAPRPSADELEGPEGPARAEPLAPVRRREQMILARAPAPDGTPLVLLLPAPTRTSPRGGFVVTLAPRLPDAGDLAFAARVESARIELEDSLRATDERARLFTRPEGFRAEVESALLDLDRAERPALLFLARSCGARSAEELALCAEEAALGECLAAVRQHAAEAALPADDPEAFGWFLERTVLAWLAARASAETRVLEPELEALLLRRAGELGRFPDLVHEALAACGDLAELDEHLARENLIFLEDGHPAARVRAFDWLAERGRAPAGYDPLAARTERRSALDRAEEAAAKSEAGPDDAASAGGAR